MAHVFDHGRAGRLLLDEMSSSARRCASSSAASADTAMSGTTPVLSQLVLVTGLIGRPQGTTIVNHSSSSCGAVGCAPPPVVSPTIFARWRDCRSYVNSSPPENVRLLVSTYTGFLPPKRVPRRSRSVQDCWIEPVSRENMSLRWTGV